MIINDSRKYNSNMRIGTYLDLTQAIKWWKHVVNVWSVCANYHTSKRFCTCDSRPLLKGPATVSHSVSYTLKIRNKNKPIYYFLYGISLTLKLKLVMAWKFWKSIFYCQNIDNYLKRYTHMLYIWITDVKYWTSRSPVCSIFEA